LGQCVFTSPLKISQTAECCLEAPSRNALIAGQNRESNFKLTQCTIPRRINVFHGTIAEQQKSIPLGKSCTLGFSATLESLDKVFVV
jgi:hypothetical protein